MRTASKEKRHHEDMPVHPSSRSSPITCPEKRFDFFSTFHQQSLHVYRIVVERIVSRVGRITYRARQRRAGRRRGRVARIELTGAIGKRLRRGTLGWWWCGLHPEQRGAGSVDWGS